MSNTINNNKKVFKKNKANEIDEYFDKNGNVKIDRLVIVPSQQNNSPFGIGVGLRWRFDDGYEDEIYVLMRDSKEERLYVKWNPTSEFKGTPIASLQVPCSSDSKYCKLIDAIEKAVWQHIEQNAQKYGIRYERQLIQGKEIQIPTKTMTTTLPHKVKDNYEPGISKIKIPMVPDSNSGGKKKSKLPPRTIITAKYSPDKGVDIINWNLRHKWKNKHKLFSVEEARIIDKEYNEAKNFTYTFDNLSEYIGAGRVLKILGFVVEGFWVGSKISLRLKARDIYYSDEVIGRKDIDDGEDDTELLLNNVMESPLQDERKEID